MKRVLEQVHAVARADSSVLILGESGVGKELIAAAVHDLSGRRDGPLVKVNCASVPRELFESEFFGHVRGAFSGAARDRQGRFLLADGGSLFLDEVGEIPLELQGKLLRVLQERTFEAVGDDRTREVDVRVIAATNRPLDVEVEQGRFRRDLFYRLNVLPIEVPPLRERRADILPMARRFLRTTADRLHLPGRELSPDDARALLATTFRATCASCRTSSNARSCSAITPTRGWVSRSRRQSQPPPRARVRRAAGSGRGDERGSVSRLRAPQPAQRAAAL